MDSFDNMYLINRHTDLKFLDIQKLATIIRLRWELCYETTTIEEVKQEFLKKEKYTDKEFLSMYENAINYINMQKGKDLKDYIKF